MKIIKRTVLLTALLVPQTSFAAPYSCSMDIPTGTKQITFDKGKMFWPNETTAKVVFGRVQYIANGNKRAYVLDKDGGVRRGYGNGKRVGSHQCDVVKMKAAIKGK